MKILLLVFSCVLVFNFSACSGERSELLGDGGSNRVYKSVAAAKDSSECDAKENTDTETDKTEEQKEKECSSLETK